MEKVNVRYEEKQGRAFVTTWECDDAMQVYDDLTHELIAKKLNGCSWIKSIKRVPLYNGFDRITVYYDHGGRRVYTVTNH